MSHREEVIQNLHDWVDDLYKDLQKSLERKELASQYRIQDQIAYLDNEIRKLETAQKEIKCI